MRIQRALISVSNKAGVVEFARGLAEMGVELVSTGGTAKALADAGLPVIPVEQVTGFPEMMEGRVKTLHPKVHGGIPGRPEQAGAYGAGPCARHHPDRPGLREPLSIRRDGGEAGVTLQDAIENIDIGGPAMVRSAAKNHASIAWSQIPMTTRRCWPRCAPVAAACLRRRDGSSR